MAQLAKEFICLFRKHGALRVEHFQLSNTEDMEDFTNISKTVLSNKDKEEEEEDLLMEQIFFRVYNIFKFHTAAN
jgi:hypothetical protein